MATNILIGGNAKDILLGGPGETTWTAETRKTT